VLAGYVFMAFLVMAASTLLSVVVPNVFGQADGSIKLPGLGWYALNLAYSFVFAIVGGHTCARLARRAEVAHAAALAGLLALLGLGLIVSSPPQIPWWWTAGEIVSGVAGVLLGGFIRAQAAAARDSESARA
jgi:hypothetical protein